MTPPTAVSVFHLHFDIFFVHIIFLLSFVFRKYSMIEIYITDLNEKRYYMFRKKLKIVCFFGFLNFSYIGTTDAHLISLGNEGQLF